MEAVASIKNAKRDIVNQYAGGNNLSALFQVLTTLLPLAGLWFLASLGPAHSYLLTILATALMSLLLLRVFVLMHECGHGSLFATPRLNRIFGFVFGVLSGMPQYVWTQHHNFHHATNGNWAKYRGPLATLSVSEYDALPADQQLAYARARRLIMAPLGGLMYLLISPRFNWAKGTLQLWRQMFSQKRLQPDESLRSIAGKFQTGYWESRTEYWHMTANNLVLICCWVLMLGWIGPALFIPVYVTSIALSGGAGIILFTVQHNFEDSYATGDEDWDYNKAAIHGTSFLELPGWLNWITASIGYHHVHHLSARIPNYRLAACHVEHQQLFASVKRLKLADIVPAMKCILWDPGLQRIISIAEHERNLLQPV